MIPELSPMGDQSIRLAYRRPSDALGIPKPEQHWPQYAHCRRKPPALPVAAPLQSLPLNLMLDRYLASEPGSAEAQHYAAALRARSEFRSLN